jgi:RimJ/RimL family protein N-acetyltransferase
LIVPAQTEEQKSVLLLYLAGKVGAPPAELVGHMPYSIFAALKASNPVGALLYTNFRGSTIEMAWAGEPGWLTPSVVRSMWEFPFWRLNCSVALGTIHRRNKASRELAERMGCKIVGVIEDCYGGGQDGILYSMSRSSCRWLQKRKGASHAEA